MIDGVRHGSGMGPKTARRKGFGGRVRVAAIHPQPTDERGRAADGFCFVNRGGCRSQLRRCGGRWPWSVWRIVRFVHGFGRPPLVFVVSCRQADTMFCASPIDPSPIAAGVRSS